jgi:hypothetical protein
MSEYRDDVGALHARIESLEQELAEAKAAERSRDDDSAAEKLAESRARVAALEAELRKAKAARAAERRPRVRAPSPSEGRKPVTTVVLAAVLVCAALFSLKLNSRDPPSRPPSHTSPSDPQAARNLQEARRLSDCTNGCRAKCPSSPPSSDPSSALDSSCLVDCLSQCVAVDGGYGSPVPR